jgi:hypothetical protein
VKPRMPLSLCERNAFTAAKIWLLRLNNWAQSRSLSPSFLA